MRVASCTLSGFEGIPIVSASIRSLRVLLDDIGTAVRASREYSRLSLNAPAKQADRLANSAFLPN